MARGARWIAAGGGTAGRVLRQLAMLAGAALLPGAPAGAQTLAVSGACAQQCGATSRLVRENRPDVQACLIRCNATQEFDHAAGIGAWGRGSG